MIVEYLALFWIPIAILLVIISNLAPISFKIIGYAMLLILIYATFNLFVAHPEAFENHDSEYLERMGE